MPTIDAPPGGAGSKTYKKHCALLSAQENRLLKVWAAIRTGTTQTYTDWLPALKKPAEVSTPTKRAYSSRLTASAAYLPIVDELERHPAIRFGVQIDRAALAFVCSRPPVGMAGPHAQSSAG